MPLGAQEKELKKKLELLKKQQKQQNVESARTTRTPEEAAAQLAAAKKILAASALAKGVTKDAGGTAAKSSGFKRPGVRKVEPQAPEEPPKPQREVEPNADFEAGELPDEDPAPPPPPKLAPRPDPAVTARSPTPRRADWVPHDPGPSRTSSSSTAPAPPPRSEAGGGKPGCTIWVGGLDTSVTEDMLSRAVADVGGPVLQVTILRRPTNPTGHGFVRLSTLEAAQHAITGLDGKELGEAGTIHVQLARERGSRAAYLLERSTLAGGSDPAKLDVDGMYAAAHSSGLADDAVHTHKRRRGDTNDDGLDDATHHSFRSRAMPRVPRKPRFMDASTIRPSAEAEAEEGGFPDHDHHGDGLHREDAPPQETAAAYYPGRPPPDPRAAAPPHHSSPSSHGRPHQGRHGHGRGQSDQGLPEDSRSLTASEELLVQRPVLSYDDF